MRGRGVADLVAAVRAATVVQCSGSDVPAFWQAMGFTLSHEMLQEGTVFALQQSGILLNVRPLLLPCLVQPNGLLKKLSKQRPSLTYP